MVKVKELIEKLKEMPQDSEVYIYENTEWSYEGIEIEDVELKPIEVGEEFCHGDRCGGCNNGEDYCMMSLDAIFPIIKPRVVLNIGIEEYKIEELEE